MRVRIRILDESDPISRTPRCGRIRRGQLRAATTVTLAGRITPISFVLSPAKRRSDRGNPGSDGNDNRESERGGDSFLNGKPDRKSPRQRARSIVGCVRRASVSATPTVQSTERIRGGLDGKAGDGEKGRLGGHTERCFDAGQFFGTRCLSLSRGRGETGSILKLVGQRSAPNAAGRANRKAPIATDKESKSSRFSAPLQPHLTLRPASPCPFCLCSNRSTQVNARCAASCCLQTHRSDWSYAHQLQVGLACQVQAFPLHTPIAWRPRRDRLPPSLSTLFRSLRRPNSCQQQESLNVARLAPMHLPLVSAVPCCCCTAKKGKSFFPLTHKI